MMAKPENYKTMILPSIEDPGRYAAPPDDETECARWDEPEDDIDWIDKNFPDPQTTNTP
jgi:hypothetical protein